MGLKISQHNNEKSLFSFNTLREIFQILTTTLLSLLIPLSFLLLARLTTTHYLFPFNTQPYSFIFYLLMYKIPSLLHALVSIVCVATLTNGLTGSKPEPRAQPGLYVAWVFLCTLQICVGLGLEVSPWAGVVLDDGYERSFLCRVVFFMGLHETMIYWWRVVVKPVVDDTIFGVMREERWVERAAVAAGFGCLWWWRLKGEVESLVVVAEIKREIGVGVGVGEFVEWWLYYLTVTIGIVRLVKGLIWFGIVMLCRRVEGGDDEYFGNEDKV